MKTYNSIKNNWTEIKLKLKQSYPQLTESDLKYVDGYENEFYHNLELKLGMNREQLMTILSSLTLEKVINNQDKKNVQPNMFDVNKNNSDSQLLKEHQ